jgi:hypothetical protein
MKRIFFFLQFVLISLTNCQTQKTKSIFGEYHKIGEYDIQVPFAGEPNITPKQENDIFKLTSYQYAYPKPSDDINFLYGIDVIEYKSSSYFKNEKLKIEYNTALNKLTTEKMFNGIIIKEDTVVYNGNYAIKQKAKINIPDIGEAYIHSIFFAHKDLVIRLFTYTPIENDNNKKILDFFESIKYK